eukprot:PhF_6_TR7743/c0_g1_i1/m.11207
MIPTTLVKDRNGNWSPRKDHSPSQSTSQAPGSGSFLPHITTAKTVHSLSARTLKDHLLSGKQSQPTTAQSGVASGSATPHNPLSPAGSAATPHSTQKGSTTSPRRPAPPPPKSTLSAAEKSVYSHLTPSKLHRV